MRGSAMPGQVRNAATRGADDVEVRRVRSNDERGCRAAAGASERRPGERECEESVCGVVHIYLRAGPYLHLLALGTPSPALLLSAFALRNRSRLSRLNTKPAKARLTPETADKNARKSSANSARSRLRSARFSRASGEARRSACGAKAAAVKRIG